MLISDLKLKLGHINTFFLIFNSYYVLYTLWLISCNTEKHQITKLKKYRRLILLWVIWWRVTFIMSFNLLINLSRNSILITYLDKKIYYFWIFFQKTYIRLLKYGWSEQYYFSKWIILLVIKLGHSSIACFENVTLCVCTIVL